MGLLRDIFGPSKNEIWSQIAAEVGGEFKKDGAMKSGGIRCQHQQWELILDTFVVSNGKSSTPYTRMRAPFVNKDDLYFKIYRKSIFTGIRSFFGMHDIEIGDPYFDDEFVIKGNNAQKIRELLADPQLKDLMNRQPRISLEIKDDEGFFGTRFPEGVDQLVFQAVGVMKDVENVKEIFELFAVVLERLVRIDSAYEDDPGVRLSF